MSLNLTKQAPTKCGGAEPAGKKITGAHYLQIRRPPEATGCGRQNFQGLLWSPPSTPEVETHPIRAKQRDNLIEPRGVFRPQPVYKFYDKNAKHSCKS